jgi:hypothetical protein
MIRDIARKPKPAKPAISKVQVDFLTQPPFGSNAKAIAHDQHPDEQLRIDRGAPYRAVNGAKCLRLPDRSTKRSIDLSRWSAGTCSSRLKPWKLFLHNGPFAHPQPNLLHTGEN